MIIIGLTGSIAMGKTTAANMLRRMGLPVHCSDEAVHDLMMPGQPGVAAVAAVFPQALDNHAGMIDRAVLRNVLGADHAQWDKLEDVLHPLVRQLQQDFLQAQEAAGAPMVVLDIPLLFETKAEERVDYTICVTAPAFIQKRRLQARQNFRMEDLIFRLVRQMPDREKRRRADFTVPTWLGRDFTRRRLEKIVAAIRKKGPT